MAPKKISTQKISNSWQNPKDHIEEYLDCNYRDKGYSELGSKARRYLIRDDM